MLEMILLNLPYFPKQKKMSDKSFLQKTKYVIIAKKL